LPEFVKDEFDAFLACGILAHGFLRLRCSECGHEKLVAFSRFGIGVIGIGVRHAYCVFLDRFGGTIDFAAQSQRRIS